VPAVTVNETEKTGAAKTETGVRADKIGNAAAGKTTRGPEAAASTSTERVRAGEGGVEARR
jgi:hypothetical protein